MSRPYAEVIGDPIAHSKSPLIHNFWLGKLGIDAEYRACHLRPEELADYFTQRRADPAWRGCNVTVPHKERVAPLLDRVRIEAAKIGAINTVFRHSKDGSVGMNTDVDGVREALRGTNPLGRPVVVIGAGGAARSAFAYLEGLGCAEVRVIVRDPAKAKAVLDDFTLPAQTYVLQDDATPFEDACIVINATQLGMSGQAAMPRFVLDALSRTAPDVFVFDMVYAPVQTELLTSAAMLDRATGHGLTMLVGQARTAFAQFFRVNPPTGLDVDLFGLLTA